MLRTLSILTLLGSSALALASPAPIVGGDKVASGRWPDVVAVIGHAGVCTGTLIAPDVVLTAGHCIEIEPYKVITHTTDHAHPYRGDHIRVKWSRAYPNWRERYDVGVIMLDHIARPRVRTVASACHANVRLAAGAPVHVVGFGLTTPGASDRNTEMYEATMGVIDPFCEHAPGCEPSIAPKGEFAAGGRGVDTCFGDSGGPALIDTADGPVLVGVVSRGLAVPGAPCGNGGIYVRADKVVAWIQSVTRRKLARTTCAGGPADDPEAAELDEAGCAAGGGGGLGVGLAGAFVAMRPRRRRARRARRGTAG